VHLTLLLHTYLYLLLSPFKCIIKLLRDENIHMYTILEHSYVYYIAAGQDERYRCYLYAGVYLFQLLTLLFPKRKWQGPEICCCSYLHVAYEVLIYLNVMHYVAER
jgi:hypothetical protein